MLKEGYNQVDKCPATSLNCSLENGISTLYLDKKMKIIQFLKQNKIPQQVNAWEEKRMESNGFTPGGQIT